MQGERLSYNHRRALTRQMQVLVQRGDYRGLPTLDQDLYDACRIALAQDDAQLSTQSQHDTETKRAKRVTEKLTFMANGAEAARDQLRHVLTRILLEMGACDTTTIPGHCRVHHRTVPCVYGRAQEVVASTAPKKVSPRRGRGVEEI